MDSQMLEKQTKLLKRKNARSVLNNLPKKDIMSREYFQKLYNAILLDNGMSGDLLTVGQLNKACGEHRFLLLRLPSGLQMGVNSKIAPLAFKKKEYKNNQQTMFVSYRSCSFQEYIGKKHGFVNS